MSELFETAIVEKRNVLNELRSNSMTVQELRFFSIYLSKINPWDMSTRVVRFSMDDFQRIMGFGRLNIAQLKSSTDSLLSKIVHVPNESGYGYKAFQLFKECSLDRDENEEWYIEIDAHDKALPLMFDFKNRYFKYALWNALRLKSANQVRMYEILKQYENLTKRELSVTELRELLGISKNEYSGRTGWSDFKKKVLESCQQALQENTDICFTYERGKVGKGGKWLSIIFYITKNTRHKDQLSLDEFIDMQPEPAPIDYYSEKEPEQYDFDESIEQNACDENILFLLDACDGAFNYTEMQLILTIISDMSLPEHKNGIQFARFHYLSAKYAALKLEMKNRTINNKFKYFKAMLENDKKNKNEN
jgi:plasmid replication initiation protein